MNSRRHSVVQVQKEGIREAENVLVPTPSHFEKLYLAPEQAVAGKLRLTFANPAPIALGGFLLASSSSSAALMGWHGAGAGTGNSAAYTGAFYFCGSILQFAGGMGEWLLGNTLPATIFFTFGGFWGTFGAAGTPFFADVTPYDTAAGFYDSFSFFFVFMAVLCFLYAIAAIRTNVCFFTILCLFTVIFSLLSASYFAGASGHEAASNTLRIAGGYVTFIANIVGWYLFFSMILEAVDFPFVLPVGDLSHVIKGRSQKEKEAAGIV